MSLTVGELFAGIGGFGLGFERAGFQVKWQVEIDDYATRVLEKHWPDVERFRDVRECGAHNLAPVDVICGGFPCQPHSLAGRRAASADERDLWGEFARIIREVRPRWVVAENVPGLLSSEDGRFFGRVLRDLAESGYDAEWDCIPASAVGAPHQRDRVWIVAYPNADAWRLEIGGISEHGDERGALRGESDGLRAGRSGTRPLADSNEQRSQGRHSAVLSERASEWPTWARDSRTFTTAVGLAREWEPESGFRRVAHGIPARVDRLRCLGNSVVPQIPEWIARRILDAEGVTA